MQSAIICVDDDMAVLRSLGEQLKRNFGHSYDIELTTNGEDAILLCAELAQEGISLPLIISDYRMNGMHGDALLIQLHKLYPNTLKIMLTGQVDTDVLGNIVNTTSLYRFISKPWDEADLICKVSEALHHYQNENRLSEHHALLKLTNHTLNRSLSLLLATLESTVEGILVLNTSGQVVSFNGNFVKLWGLDTAHAVADAFEPQVDIAEIKATIKAQLTEPVEHLFQISSEDYSREQRNYLTLKNGKIIEYHLRPQQLMGEHVGNVWSFRDVTQELAKQETLKHQALHDPLTQLPNRAYFDTHVKSAIARVKSNGGFLCIMFIDLDGFKTINDTYGHTVGDSLLQSVVHRFQGCVRDSDILSRWGGDEFVLCAKSEHEKRGAQCIAKKLVNILQPPFHIEGYELQISTSIGIAIYPSNGSDYDRLLRNADTALYEAKQSGRNQFRFYRYSHSIL